MAFNLQAVQLANGELTSTIKAILARHDTLWLEPDV